jgi:isopentenyl-diphosphate delta-isomerase
MGIDLRPEYAYKFIYRTGLDKDLIEHELDYVFTALFDGEPDVNSREVEDWKYIGMNALREDIAAHPERYTYWFRMIMNHQQLSEHLLSN